MSHDATKNSMKGLPKVVAIDFDGTLVEDRFPDIGRPYENMFNLVKVLQDKGVKVVLWTSRDGERLEKAISFCNDKGIVFDAVNENIKEVQEMFHTDTRKIYADIYLDDKAYLPCIYLYKAELEWLLK